MVWDVLTYSTHTVLSPEPGKVSALDSLLVKAISFPFPLVGEVHTRRLEVLRTST